MPQGTLWGRPRGMSQGTQWCTFRGTSQGIPRGIPLEYFGKQLGGEILVNLDGIIYKVLQEFTFKEVTVMQMECLLHVFLLLIWHKLDMDQHYIYLEHILNYHLLLTAVQQNTCYENFKNALNFAEAYTKPSRTSKTKLYDNIVNCQISNWVLNTPAAFALNASKIFKEHP